MTAFLAAGLGAGLVVRPLLAPWILASGLFVLNYSVSLFFMRAIPRLSTSAAAGVAVLSFFLRFGLLGIALVGVALGLREYFMTTAVCFLLIYTLFLVFEIAVGLRGRTVISPGGEA
ncbi:MAG: hypothetical protein IBX61_09170 [Thermoleophilia bacterium]|nr:hypothetical protein [Thermoleophilia bacterium]